MKLPTGSIKKCAHLEKLFLARFFDDDTKTSLPTLLTISRRKGGLSRRLWRDFGAWHSDVLVAWPSPLGRNVSPQFTNCPPGSNRNGGILHLEATGATRRKCRRDHREGQSWSK